MALEALDIGKDPVPDPGIRRSKVQLGKLLLSYPFYILMDFQSDASSNYLHPMALQNIVAATVDEFRFAEILPRRYVQVQLLLPFPFQRLFNGFSPPVLSPNKFLFFRERPSLFPSGNQKFSIPVGNSCCGQPLFHCLLLQQYKSGKYEVQDRYSNVQVAKKYLPALLSYIQVILSALPLVPGKDDEEV